MTETYDVSKTSRYYVYVLLSSKDHKFYCGFTNNLKCRRPLKLIFYEYFINKSDAKARKVFLKSGFGRRELRKALNKTLSTILWGQYNNDSKNSYRL